MAEQFPQALENTIVMETGGMKGKRPEMTKNELHSILKQAFHLKHIYSEYGMTELSAKPILFPMAFFKHLSMKVTIRDLQDPMSMLAHHQVGGINIIDLANINSVASLPLKTLEKQLMTGDLSYVVD